MKRNFFLFALFAVVFFPNRSVTAQWVQTSGPAGGKVNALAVVNGNLFAGTDGGGVFRSTNNGDSWAAVNNGLPPLSYINSFVINGTTLFAGTKGGLFLSTDNGASWTNPDTRLLGTNITWLALSDDKTLYALSYDYGLFFSGNNASSWTMFPSLTGRTCFAVNGNSLFAGTSESGIFRYDGSWTQVGSNYLPTYRDVHGVHYYSVYSIVAYGGYLFAKTYGGAFGSYLSTDNGTSWGPTPYPLTNPFVFSSGAMLGGGVGGVSRFTGYHNPYKWLSMKNIGLSKNETVYSLAVNGANLFAGTSHGVFLSTNNGDNWVGRSNGLRLTNTSIEALGVSGGTIFASCQYGAFSSKDSGTNWKSTYSGLANYNVHAFTVSGGNLFAGTENGVGRSTDSGMSWLATDNGLNNMSITCLTASGTDLFAGSTDAGIFRSTDSGATWITHNKGLTDTIITALTVSSGNLFAGTSTGGVFRSTNKGVSWSKVNNGLPNYTHFPDLSTYFRTIRCFVVNGNNIFAGTEVGLYHSTNNGVNWTVSDSGLPPPFVGIYSTVLMGNNIFAAGPYGIFLSSDNGLSWRRADSGFFDATNQGTWVQALTASGTNLFAGTSGGVFLSSNNGTSWVKTLSGAGVYPGGYIYSLTFIGSNLFAGTNSGLLRSANNGRSWTPVQGGLTRFTSFAESGGKLFAGNYSGIFRSTDSGMSWIAAADSGLPYYPYVQALAVSGSNLFTAVGLAGLYSAGPRVFLSTDMGASWAKVDTGLADNYYIAALAVSGTNLFAGGDGVFLSTNNGTNWIPVNTGLTNKGVQDLAVSEGNLFAGTDGGIFLSTDNGTSWTAANNGIPSNYPLSSIKTIAVSGTNIFAGSDGTDFVRSSDYGAGVFLSNDNGSSWKAVNTGLMNLKILTLALSGGNLYAGTNGSGIWRRPLSEMTGGNGVEVLPSVKHSTGVYPNPFSQSTTIRFSSSDHNFAQVTVVNLLGSEVARLFSGELEAGEHSFTWDASRMPRGMYECVIRTGGHVDRVPMIVVR